jgi:hypothetical protein
MVLVNNSRVSHRRSLRVDMSNSTSQKRSRIRESPELYTGLGSEILERDDWHCLDCGCSKNLDVQHVPPSTPEDCQNVSDGEVMQNRSLDSSEPRSILLPEIGRHRQQ